MPIIKPNKAIALYVALNFIRMKNVLLLLLICTGILLSECTSVKATSGSAPAEGKVTMEVSEASALLDIVKSTEPAYTWFSASGTGKIDWDGQRLSAKLDVRIRRDSVIWAQISKLGFEVGRMLITPDSAFFINRLERSYSRYGTKDFLKKYNLPADFKMFSKVFTGGAYIPPSVSSSMIESDGALLLKGSGGISARHWIDTQHKLMRSQVTDAGNRKWDATYQNYQAVNTGQNFPFDRGNSLQIDGVTNLFDLTYTSILIDIPQSLPFSIPSHYEKL